MVFIIQDEQFSAERDGGHGGEVSGRCSERRPDPGVLPSVSRPLAPRPDGTQRLDGADARRAQRPPPRGGEAGVLWVLQMS